MRTEPQVAGSAGGVGVSVVIPCYACESTVVRAVESVAGQTARPRELILVDDHSPDGTLECMYALRRRYGAEWVRVISLPRNGGPSAARNAGWDAATQPYVAFLDADEVWHPRKVELQHGWMSARPEVALTGHRRVAGAFPAELAGGLGARRVTLRALLLRNCFPTASVMLRRELSARFEPAKRHSEDYLLWLQIVSGGHHAWWFDAPLVRAYKAPYGEGGLSRDVWKMTRGEMDTYRRLHRQGRLPAAGLALLVPLSLAKHLVRAARVAGRDRARGRAGEEEARPVAPA